MSGDENAIYLERSSYRRRRARDASRLLPILALILFFIPGLWQISSLADGVSTTAALIFLFTVWIVLILLAFFLARYLTAPVVKEGDMTEETSGHD